jgi:potassium-transporting ATPase potassium-binding subunit
MTSTDVIQVILYLVVLCAATPLLGTYMVRVFDTGNAVVIPGWTWAEHLIYRVSSVDPKRSMDWKEYLKALLLFNFLGFVVVFLILIFQHKLPWNPQGLPALSWHLAFNTAASFMTNTNWQSYAGETTVSYFSQMVGFTVQNFLSAATGIAVFLALARGIAQRSSQFLGNFWVDMTRGVLYLLLPLSIFFTVVLVGQGVVQNFHPYVTAHTVEGANQLLPMGPAASQIAIKQLGTNGGGFFNVNSAHPFENPTPLSNWLEMLAILLIPMALTYTYGSIVKSRKQGWVIFAAMMTMFLCGLGIALYAEYSSNPIFGMGAMMEGKETRFGVVNSVIWAVATSAASNGSVNAMHSSLSPLTGGVAMFNIKLGEIIWGGVGAGLYGMLIFVFLTVFLSGLMVGRTPEYMGKKIETREIKWTLLAILVPNALVLLGSGIAAVLPVGLSSLANKGPHGLSEILYAFASASNNNGSAFAGLNANTAFYNVVLGICILLGRFSVIIPVLAISGSLAVKKWAAPSEGSFNTESALFVALLIAVILIVGALTFLPSLSLGPILEHLLMRRGITF